MQKAKKILKFVNQCYDQKSEAVGLMKTNKKKQLKFHYQKSSNQPIE